MNQPHDRTFRPALHLPALAQLTTRLLHAAVSPLEDPVVVSLAERRLTELTEHLPTDSRPLPTVNAYDSLLTGTRDA